jgi:hypothetical protein
MDPTNRPLEIVLGNQSVSLFFDFAAIRAFEKETGNHFMNWVASVTKQAQIMSLELMMIGTTEEAMLNDLDKMRFAELMGSASSAACGAGWRGRGSASCGLRGERRPGRGG